jgi:hypothetical protein
MRKSRCLLTVLAAASAAGCLQIETHVKLHQDGSATITERLRLSKRLLDLSDQEGPAKGITARLSREATLERLKQMGKGMRLVSHTVRDAPKGARESIAVFEIPDINEFQYLCPYLALDKYPKHTLMKCKLFPIYKRAHGGWARLPGQMGVSFYPATRERRRRREEPGPRPPSPTELQVLRDLQPVLRDLMQDFRLTFTFESYAPLRFRPYYRFRGQSAGTKKYDLIDFSSENLDEHGFELLSNEEVMLELARLRMGGPNIGNAVEGHAGNVTVPVYHPHGTPEIYFNPSRHFFDKYFKGKTLHFYEKEGGPRPARWKDIGHHEPPREGK